MQAWDFLSQNSAEPIPIVTGHPRMNPGLQQVPVLQCAAWAHIQHQGAHVCKYTSNQPVLPQPVQCVHRQVNAGESVTSLMYRACVRDAPRNCKNG